MSNDDARARLLRAAGPVFADKGFQAATVREICQQAEVNIAAVNYHFGDKEQLYVETIKNAHHQRAAEVPGPQWPPNTPPAQKLRDFVRVLATRMLSTPDDAWQPRLMLREVLQPTKACEELVRDYFRPLFNQLLEILDEILPPEAPLHRRYQIGFSVIGQCLHYRVARKAVSMLVDGAVRDQHFQVEQLAEHIAEFTLAALGCVPPLAGQGGASAECAAGAIQR